MIERPAIPDEAIRLRLQADYGLSDPRLTFLPLGFDLNSAVFRAVTDDATAYFVKLRRGAFDPIAVTLPRFLSDRGVRQIIAPISTQAGPLWTGVNEYQLIVYPFVDGQTAREVRLSERQWSEFGAAVKRLHSARLPPAIVRTIPQLTYSPKWRDRVKSFVATVRNEPFVDPISVRLAALLTARRSEILALVERAEQFARRLQLGALPLVVCHTDIHAGNLLIGADDALYIVDWDSPLLAPKERDLMFIGGGQGFVGHTAEQEEALFYRGYGDAPVDRGALAYFRCERIIEDIALACEQLFSSDGGGADRELALQYLEANFLPGGTIEAAHRRKGTEL